jgi:hypothetical protein
VIREGRNKKETVIREFVQQSSKQLKGEKK